MSRNLNHGAFAACRFSGEDCAFHHGDFGDHDQDPVPARLTAEKQSEEWALQRVKQLAEDLGVIHRIEVLL